MHYYAQIDIFQNSLFPICRSSDAIEGRTVIKEAVVSEEPQQVEDLPVPRLEIGPDGKIVINEARWAFVVHNSSSSTMS